MSRGGLRWWDNSRLESNLKTTASGTRSRAGAWEEWLAFFLEGTEIKTESRNSGARVFRTARS
jgi:hypothetical protein